MLLFGVPAYTVYDGAKNTYTYDMAMFGYGFRYNLSAMIIPLSVLIPWLVQAAECIAMVMQAAFCIAAIGRPGQIQLRNGCGYSSRKNQGCLFGAGLSGSFTIADGESIVDEKRAQCWPRSAARFRFGVMETPP